MVNSGIDEWIIVRILYQKPEWIMKILLEKSKSGGGGTFPTVRYKVTLRMCSYDHNHIILNQSLAFYVTVKI